MHPLAMITAGEIADAAALFRAHCRHESLLFSSITLREPTRSQMTDHATDPATHPVDRRLDVCAAIGPDTLAEAIVNLTTSTVDSYVEVEGMRPMMLIDETFSAMLAVQADPRFAAAMARRGITDLDRVQMDPWPPGTFGHEFEPGRRLTKIIFYERHFPEDNGYAHPIENVYAYVDLTTHEIVEMHDGDVVPVPQTECNYYADRVGELRTDLKPLEITQADGPSFSVDGNAVAWQRWRLRVSMHPIEGLVLHEIEYDDPAAGRVRPIAYRASVSEMVVPYGSSHEMHYWKNAFDCGEWGLGRMVNSLTLGCDCLGEIHYFDAVMSDEHGNAHNYENVICMHEEDYGILWKHRDLHSGTSEVRRSRRLVVSSIYTVGNYEYGFFWYFYLDGTIQLEVKLTGIVQPFAIDPAADPSVNELALRTANLVTPDIAAPHHQHLFCVRLDVNVDGATNSVYEVDAVPMAEGPDNPYNNAFVAQATLLESEHDAQRVVDAARSRTWRISNPTVTNAVGAPVAYKLVPQATPTLLAGPSSYVYDRARFATKNLWVTRGGEEDHHDQRYAAGRYPSQSLGGDGLPAYAEGNRSIVDTDVVLWHTFGVTHLVRPEDFPVMPVEYTGFSLVPFGFFDRNPALDVPPSPEARCH